MTDKPGASSTLQEAGPLQQAHADLVWLAKRFAGLMALVPMLEQLGSLEKLTQETQKNLQRYQENEARIKAEAFDIDERKEPVLAGFLRADRRFQTLRD